MSAWRLDTEAVGRTRDGEAVMYYTFSQDGRQRATFSNLGASLIALFAPDRVGRWSNVAVALSAVEDYWHPGRNTHAMGATVGRFSRCVPYGRLALEGHLHTLSVNEGRHHFHGGLEGFSQRVWRVAFSPDAEATIRFCLESVDGDQGYPGTLQAQVRYAFHSSDVLHVTYDLRCDRTTLAGLCSHAYWNLAAEGDIDEHVLQISADHVVGADRDHLPDGSFIAVEGSPLDFRRGARIGARRVDNCFHFRTGRRQARLSHLRTGRFLEIDTDHAALAVHTGDTLEVSRQGIALQATDLPYLPLGPFKNAVLPAGVSRRRSTSYRFGLLG